MYEKKDIIYSSTMGLCIVKDVTKLSPDRSSPVPYYVLRAYYDKEKTAYIPVENHAVDLRCPISKEEAEAEIEVLINSDIEDDERIKRIGELAYVLETTIDDIRIKLGDIIEEE